VLRHSVLWVLRDSTTEAQRHEMLQGLAFLRTECFSVQRGDYGDDLFGGAEPLRALPPARRIPLWRRDGMGPPANFDVALHLDFDDWESFREYVADPAHNAASDFNKKVAWDELTARVDWYFEEPSLTRRGHVRHVAMFVWRDGIGDGEREAALAAAAKLRDATDVEQVAIGHNSGQGTTDYDWIVDVHLPSRAAAERFLAGPDYAAAMETVAAHTRFEWTARMSHVMRGAL
jgi:Stress responsive A/B Barrel Domain